MKFQSNISSSLNFWRGLKVKGCEIGGPESTCNGTWNIELRPVTLPEVFCHVATHAKANNYFVKLQIFFYGK